MDTHCFPLPEPKTKQCPGRFHQLWCTEPLALWGLMGSACRACQAAQPAGGSGGSGWECMVKGERMGALWGGMDTREDHTP
eukprot:441569-Pelagomonas_calceolata.AAC.2